MNSNDLGLELQIIEMHFTNGKNVKEIAKSLKVSAAVVNKVIDGYKAIEKMVRGKR